MVHLKTILFLISIGCIGNALGQGATITLTPLGFNASLRSEETITFQCTSEGTNVNWLVNDSFPGAVGVGISISPAMQSGGFITSNLLVPAREENDNIMILCFTLINNQGVVSSSLTAIFQVQGLLESPSDPATSELNATHRQLTWSPPFTLDITDEELDIIGYSVCDNVTGSCEMATETEYTYLNLQVPIEFAISALNVVGEGNVSVVIHDPCNPDEDPANVDGSSVQTSVSFAEGNTITTFTFSLEITCFSVYMIETTEGSIDNSTVLSGPLIPTVIDVAGNVTTLAVSVNSSLTVNAVHGASIIAVSVAGSAPSTGMVQFTTFDVQEVSVSEGPGSITITCTFAEGSLANGYIILHVHFYMEYYVAPIIISQRSFSKCTATFDVQEVSISEGPGSITITCIFAEGSLANGCHIILHVENVTDITMNINREEQSGGQLSQTAVDQVSGLDIGTYEVTVFDLESDNSIDLQNPIQVVEVNVTEVQPSSSPTTSINIPSSPSTGPTVVFSGSKNTTVIITDMPSSPSTGPTVVSPGSENTTAIITDMPSSPSTGPTVVSSGSENTTAIITDIPSSPSTGPTVVSSGSENTTAIITDMPSSPTTGPTVVSPGSENTTAIITDTPSQSPITTIIVGAVIGSVIFIGILLMCIWILYCRRRVDKPRHK